MPILYHWSVSRSGPGLRVVGYPSPNGTGEAHKITGVTRISLNGSRVLVIGRDNVVVAILGIPS